MTDRDQTVSFVTGGGIGFLLGWLLNRKKPAGQIVLSDLRINPLGYPSAAIVISVKATNVGRATSATLVAQVENTVMPSVEYFEEGEVKTVEWNYMVEGYADTKNITISVNPLRDTINVQIPAD